MNALRLTSLLALLPLAACISFGEKPPATLMTLTAEQKLEPGTAQTATPASAIGVMVPSVPQSLSTLRVPVQASPTAVAYLKDAQWVEPPSRLFRNLLAETISARTGRMVADVRNMAVATDTRLTGRLVNFGFDAASSEAVVTYDAALVRTGSDEVSSRRFEARAPATARAESVATALNRAANEVAGQVADWVK
jgi:cholesterol transport system auxiliary component